MTTEQHEQWWANRLAEERQESTRRPSIWDRLQWTKEAAQKAQRAESDGERLLWVRWAKRQILAAEKQLSISKAQEIPDYLKSLKQRILEADSEELESCYIQQTPNSLEQYCLITGEHCSSRQSSKGVPGCCCLHCTDWAEVPSTSGESAQITPTELERLAQTKPNEEFVKASERNTVALGGFRFPPCPMCGYRAFRASQESEQGKCKVCGATQKEEETK